MSRSTKLYSGRLIGAAGMTLIYWSVPLVLYTLVARMNPDSAEAQRLAQRWLGKNQPGIIGLLSLLTLIVLLWDWRQVRKGTATVKSALRFGIVMAAVQWVNFLTGGDHKEFWVINTAYSSLMAVTLVLGTRLVAMEVERLEGNARSA